MHRFFLPTSSFQDDTVSFPPETTHQIRRVLRLRTGEKIVCLDNQGWVYRVELTEIGATRVLGSILARDAVSGEPPVRLHMLLCLSQREKFEWMLQKCTEVGAGEFTPVLSSRSLVQETRSLENKYPRWARIIQEAAEQSGRGRIPRLNPTVPFDTALKQTAPLSDLRLLVWEGEQTLRLTEALRAHNNIDAVSLLIGPEGGLSAEEAALAADNGWKSVSLGRRILRMETAAVVSAALTVDWFDSLAG